MKKKKMILPGIMFVLGVAVLILGIVLSSVAVANSKYEFRVDKLQVLVNSDDDQYYSVKLNIDLKNKTNQDVSGTLMLVLEDQHKNKHNVTVGNISIEQNKTKSIKDISTNEIWILDKNQDDGLDYDIKVVEARVGTTVFEKNKFLSNFVIPLIVSVALILGGVLILVIQNMREEGDDENNGKKAVIKKQLKKSNKTVKN